MEQETRKLLAAMQLHYGEEFRRKWQGFSPKEISAVWIRKFELAGIHRTVVERLADEIVWPHPPALPVIVEALEALQERLHREQKERQAALALPPPDQVARADSPLVQQALAEMRRFIASHTIC